MSNKEQCINIIEKIPEEQLSYIAVFLENAYKMIDEMLDDAFCSALTERYDAREDKDEAGIPIEDLAAELGIVLGEEDED